MAKLAVIRPSSKLGSYDQAWRFHDLCRAGSAEASHFPKTEWQRQSPAALGFDVGQLGQAFDSIRKFNCIGAMAVRNGEVAQSVGALADKSLVSSVRNSLLSALVGVAVARKDINLGATLGQLASMISILSLTTRSARPFAIS